MGTDDCAIRTPADELADESAHLGAAKREGRLTPIDLERAAATAKKAAELFIAERPYHEPAFGALVNVTGILAGAGRLAELAPHALAVMRHVTDWPGRDAAWKDLLYNGLFGAMDRSPPENILPVLELGREAARQSGSDALRRSLAETARDAAKALGTVGRWDLHERLEAFFGEEAAGLAGMRAAYLTDAIALAFQRKERDRALAFYDRVREVANRHPEKDVAVHQADALEYLLSENTPEPYLEPARIAVLVDEQLSLTERWPDEREVARAFTSASVTVLSLLEVMRDHRRHASVTTRQYALSLRWPGDEELHFNSARALVNAAVVRVNETKRTGLVARVTAWLSGDATLDRLQSTMESLLVACPASEPLEEARARFERTTGRTVRAPANQTPPAPPLHPSLQSMRDTFAKMQDDGIVSEHLAAMHEVIGSGGYLPRATKEGKSTYSTDERYYLDLLDEIARQFVADTTGYWKAREVQVEAITRYLIDEATDAIAARAARLRSQLRMPPRKRG